MSKKTPIEKAILEMENRQKTLKTESEKLKQQMLEKAMALEEQNFLIDQLRLVEQPTKKTSPQKDHSPQSGKKPDLEEMLKKSIIDVFTTKTSPTPHLSAHYWNLALKTEFLPNKWMQSKGMLICMYKLSAVNGNLNALYQLANHLITYDSKSHLEAVCYYNIVLASDAPSNLKQLSLYKLYQLIPEDNKLLENTRSKLLQQIENGDSQDEKTKNNQLIEQGINTGNVSLTTALALAECTSHVNQYLQHFKVSIPSDFYLQLKAYLDTQDGDTPETKSKSSSGQKSP